MARMPVSVEKMTSIARFAIDTGLVIGLALIGAKLFWLLVAPTSNVSVAASTFSAPETPTPPLEQSLDKSILIEYNPFAASVDALSETQIIDAPETSLNLTLKGLRARENGEGVAFILLPDNRQIRVGVGDKVLDNVTVERVYADRVALRTNGQLESLFYREDDDRTGIVSTAAQRAEASAASANSSRATVSARALLAGIGLSVVRENGQRTGYRITSTGNDSVLRSAGLESGDILRKVNSQSISDFDGEELQELFLRSSQADFQIERDTQLINISLAFKEGG